MSGDNLAGRARGAQLSAAAMARLRRLRPDGPDEMGRELAEGPEAVAATLRLLGRQAPELRADLRCHGATDPRRDRCLARHGPRGGTCVAIP